MKPRNAATQHSQLLCVFRLCLCVNFFVPSNWKIRRESHTLHPGLGVFPADISSVFLVEPHSQETESTKANLLVLGFRVPVRKDWGLYPYLQSPDPMFFPLH